MISGSQLKPGKLAKQFAERQLGKKKRRLLFFRRHHRDKRSACKRMMAHSDETDDFLPKCYFHPDP